jgi:hypothetical protein
MCITCHHSPQKDKKRVSPSQATDVLQRRKEEAPKVTNPSESENRCFIQLSPRKFYIFFFPPNQQQITPNIGICPTAVINHHSGNPSQQLLSLSLIANDLLLLRSLIVDLAPCTPCAPEPCYFWVRVRAAARHQNRKLLHKLETEH